MEEIDTTVDFVPPRTPDRRILHDLLEDGSHPQAIARKYGIDELHVELLGQRLVHHLGEKLFTKPERKQDRAALRAMLDHPEDPLEAAEGLGISPDDIDGLHYSLLNTLGPDLTSDPDDREAPKAGEITHLRIRGRTPGGTAFGYLGWTPVLVPGAEAGDWAKVEIVDVGEEVATARLL